MNIHMYNYVKKIIATVRIVTLLVVYSALPASVLATAPGQFTLSGYIVDSKSGETLTEQSYRYIKSVEDYDSNDFAIFQEPITIMGNFNGALGNLFSSSSQTISIRQ